MYKLWIYMKSKYNMKTEWLDIRCLVYPCYLLFVILIGRALYDGIIRIYRRRREVDNQRNIVGMFVNEEVDPADNDPVLKEQLDRNREIGQRNMMEVRIDLKKVYLFFYIQKTGWKMKWECNLIHCTYFQILIICYLLFIMATLYVSSSSIILPNYIRVCWLTVWLRDQ